MKSDFQFTPVKFTGIRKPVSSPVAASVRKTCPTRVVFRFSDEAIKKAQLKPGEHLTPFVDLQNRALLLLQGERPQPESSRRIYATTGRAYICELPRANELAELFPGVTLAIPLTLIEATPGRIVLTIPKAKAKA